MASVLVGSPAVAAETANRAMTSLPETQFPVIHYSDAHREAASGNRLVSEAMKVLPGTEGDGTDRTSIEEIVDKANPPFGSSRCVSEFQHLVICEQTSIIRSGKP